MRTRRVEVTEESAFWVELQAAGAGQFHLAAGHRRRGSFTPAQLSMLLEGIDWRRPIRTSAPQMAV